MTLRSEIPQPCSVWVRPGRIVLEVVRDSGSARPFEPARVFFCCCHFCFDL